MIRDAVYVERCTYRAMQYYAHWKGEAVDDVATRILSQYIEHALKPEELQFVLDSLELDQTLGEPQPRGWALWEPRLRRACLLSAIGVAGGLFSLLMNHLRGAR